MDFVWIRNKFFHGSYVKILRPLLFRFDPEFMHNSFVLVGKILGSNGLTKWAVRKCFDYENGALEQNILGIKFRNPIGLSAGFDKNAELIEVMDAVGFGFVEVGSITAKASDGNGGRRMKRVVHRESLWINLGLNNRGADEVHGRLKRLGAGIPFGVNIAKTNCRETADDGVGLKDYIYSTDLFRDAGDYITLNISCPNAYGGQPFSRVREYEKLLKAVEKLKIGKPVFVKLSPDLNRGQIKKIIQVSEKYKISGFVCSNLTKTGKSGGFSGKILKKKSDELLSYVYGLTKGKYVLIGAGGVSSAEDAYGKIKLGANLVEMVSGLIYEGPGIVGEINYGLVKLMKAEGYKNIGDAVGRGNIFK